jgi:hypothetical protein
MTNYGALSKFMDSVTTHERKKIISNTGQFPQRTSDEHDKIDKNN